MTQKLRDEGFTVSKYRYPPGTYFPMHTHAEDKVDAVLKGRFKITWDGGSSILESGDMIRIPAETRHSAEAIGTETVISLDAVKI